MWSKSAQIGSILDVWAGLAIIQVVRCVNIDYYCLRRLTALRFGHIVGEQEIVRTLGRYTLTQRLGEGSLAEVWLTRHPKLGCDVAIKRLYPHIVRQLGVKERFQREAQVLAALHHPHIIQVYDFEVAGDEAYLVMEYIAGSTLDARLQSLRNTGRQMRFEEMWSTFAAIASAVNCAHHSGVTHRDLKPANVLLRSNGTPVLSDFGLAYIIEGTQYALPGRALGMPAYIAPEQCDARPVDARTDIYALGVLLFEMVTGRPPFQAGHPIELILKHLNEPVPRPTRWRPDLSSETEAVILRALAKDPGRRFATVGDMLSALPNLPSAIQSSVSLPLTVPSPPPFRSPPLNLFGDQFIDEIKTAFQSYGRMLELAQSPLAYSPLIAPTLILNELHSVQLTADDRGRALRIVLRWAVKRLAPTPPRYPMGTYRPPDDPSWQNPLWWRYNILRHRYVEPLPPDSFREGYRLVGTLIARMGISSRDRFYAERDRAISDVAILLREQVSHHQSDVELQRLAAQELYQSVEGFPAAQNLLGIAATLRDVFPRSLLVEMASREDLPYIQTAHEHLLTQRLLQPREGGHELMIPPAIQMYVHARQPEGILTRRHQWAAGFYLEQGRPIEIAWHLKMGGRCAEAVDVLLEAADGLVDSLELEVLRDALFDFTVQQLDVTRWYDVQILLSDLWRRTGNQKRARDACREALKVATGHIQQARIYRRLGKLYEDYDQEQAMDYYLRANKRFPSDHIGRLALLKDRAWLYIHQREWRKAEEDLMLALKIINQLASAQAERADVYNALAGLYRRQARYVDAISHARRALILREEYGDSQQIAHSWNNLGLIYAEMGHPSRAIPAYEEALTTFRQMDNQEAIATVSLNIGGALYYVGNLHQAMEYYRQSLAIFHAIDLPHGEAEAHYNLAETLSDLKQVEEARRHWRECYAISQRAELSDLLQLLEKLRDEKAILDDVTPETSALVIAHSPITSTGENAYSDQSFDLSPEEQVALEIAQYKGRVTPRALMEKIQISKSTATRKLTHLFELGVLERRGQGRGTHYVVP